MLFVKDRFSQLDQLNTPMSNVKVLAEMWKNLGMKEREVISMAILSDVHSQVN